MHGPLLPARGEPGTRTWRPGQEPWLDTRAGPARTSAAPCSAAALLHGAGAQDTPGSAGGSGHAARAPAQSTQSSAAAQPHAPGQSPPGSGDASQKCSARGGAAYDSRCRLRTRARMREVPSSMRPRARARCGAEQQRRDRRLWLRGRRRRPHAWAPPEQDFNTQACGTGRPLHPHVCVCPRNPQRPRPMRAQRGPRA